MLNKYGILTPDHWLFRVRPMDFVVRIAETHNEEQQKLSEEEQTKIELQKKQLEKQMSDNQKTYEKIKKAIEHTQDPMEPLHALMLRAINNVDLGTINEVQTVLLGITARFLENGEDSKESKDWSPYTGISRKYLDYLTDAFRTYLSMCDRQKLDSVKLTILETSEKISDQVVSANSTDIDVLLALWKEVADNAIGKSREIFNRIMQIYKKLATTAFEKGIEDNKNWLDEIFRQLGWLGERLLSRIGIEEKPLMRDYTYFNEYDQLFEVLLTCSHEYNNKYPTSYPLIYFDFVDVIFLQLETIAKETQTQKLKGDIFSCLYVYSSFAEAAIPKENSNGAALAIIRLKESYDKLLSDGLEESAKEAIGLLVTLGGMAFKQREKLQGVEFISDGRIDHYILDTIVKSPFGDKISYAIREAYIRQDTNWDFVIEMGKRLKTNFGFMFDWTTGELYPEDDPRRR